MKFEWDERKNQSNGRKHGVSFEEARGAFLDPQRKIRLNKKHSGSEKRFFCFGRVGSRVMTVRFTMRRGNIRIIGAGYWREGRRIYEKN
ncbi:MAG: BrnT family toxin [Deltaproteobacteria bacterium]|nr:BrnT family toxin [Deltaproteobacteria bacterium]